MINSIFHAEIHENVNTYEIIIEISIYSYLSIDTFD